MIYIASVTDANQPPEGCLNIEVCTLPDTYRFFTPIPLDMITDKNEIVSRVIAYCSGSDLPVPIESEVLVKNVFM